MPARSLQGYSQSMSMPSRPYSSTALRQQRAKYLRPSSVRAISEKPPAPHPPTESTMCMSGFHARNCGRRSRCVSFSKVKPPSRIRPKARLMCVKRRKSSRVNRGSDASIA